MRTKKSESHIRLDSCWTNQRPGFVNPVWGFSPVSVHWQWLEITQVSSREIDEIDETWWGWAEETVGRRGPARGSLLPPSQRAAVTHGDAVDTRACFPGGFRRIESGGRTRVTRRAGRCRETDEGFGRFFPGQVEEDTGGGEDAAADDARARAPRELRQARARDRPRAEDRCGSGHRSRRRARIGSARAPGGDPGDGDAATGGTRVEALAVIRLLKFDPDRVSVSFAEDTCRRIAEPDRTRRTPSAHNDLTQHLTLSVASDFNPDGQADVWYTRLLRAEVLAEWCDDGLHVHCNVTVEGHWWIAWAEQLRAIVFRRWTAPRPRHPALRRGGPPVDQPEPRVHAPVFVHFHEGPCRSATSARFGNSRSEGVREYWGCSATRDSALHSISRDRTTRSCRGAGVLAGARPVDAGERGAGDANRNRIRIWLVRRRRRRRRTGRGWRRGWRRSGRARRRGGSELR